MRVEEIADYGCECGEAPIWHAAEQKLYWCDIPRGRLYRYDPATGEHGLVHEDRLIGAVVVQEDGSLLLLRDRGNVVRLRDGQLETVIEQVQDEKAFNDAIADPSGRVFSGTCAVGKPDCPGEYERYGKLYRIDLDGTWRAVHEGELCSNGLGFSLDSRRMYFTDSTKCTIFVFDYDPGTGEIANQRVLVTTGLPARPDGLTVDAEDHVWSAQWDGGCVVRYTPEGKLERRIEMPGDKMTSVMFGGAELDELYVTSVRALFRVSGLGIKGRPEFLSRIQTLKDKM